MSLILKPIITEKSLSQAARGVYTFAVPRASNKLTIAQAVKEQFKVDSTDIRISITKGKVKRFRQVKGRRVDVKKAFVQLVSGQRIAAFDLGQETPEPTKKPAKKAEKKAAKPAKAEAK